MRVLFLGDIFGKPGRKAIKQWLPAFRAERAIDFVIGNGENAAGGKGITEPVARELFQCGIDVLTGGNHSFHHRDALNFFDREPRLLRPANYPPGIPGHGLGVYSAPGGRTVAVLNLQGRAFMKPIDCPYRTADALIPDAIRQTPILIVDFHAEATSEKVAMAAYLDGRVSAVIGTHTHIPTADARVSRAGTAAITDVGMCGPFDSVIGVQTEIVLDQLIGCLPVRHQVAEGEGRICALQIDLDDRTGRAQSAEFILHPAWPRTRE